MICQREESLSVTNKNIFMQKIIFKQKLLAIIIAGFAAMAPLSAQTCVLDEPLTTTESFYKFTSESVIGNNHNWHFNEQYGAVMSGYTNPNSYENDDWFISPEINLDNFDNAKLSFDHTRGSAAVMNVGVAEGWYQVFATANYTGNVSTTTWIEIIGVNNTVLSAWTYISSGKVEIPAAAISNGTRIAFRYRSSSTQSSTWEIKNVKVYGTPSAIPGVFDFKITTWNTEWLSCLEPQFNSKDRELQINNIVSIIKTMNSDLVALQEVGTSNLYTTVDTLVSRLGSEWAGSIVTSSYNGNCGQNQGIVYKTSKIQLVKASLMNSGDSYQGNTYSYNWSSGRFPALYNLKLIAGDVPFPVSVVNIHAKSAGVMSEHVTSHLRREGASYALKNILDGNTYKTDRVIVIGDFNDYLIGTGCAVCSGISPYKNFMDDTDNYKGITSDLIIPYPYPYYGYPVIDNIIISNELFDNYVLNSTMMEIDALETVYDYATTTTDHIPVSSTLRFEVMSSGIILNKNYIELLLGGTEQLTATVLPITANQNVSWSSSNPTVASVVDGLVTAHSTGETVITATTPEENYIAKCSVAVVEKSGLLNVWANNMLFVYPNPVKDMLIISFGSSSDNGKLKTEGYTIFNIAGQVLIEGNLPNETTTINVKSLPCGMYFIKVGNKTGKFIKE